MNTLDLETGSERFESHYGLEPWRARHGTAWITSISIYHEDNSHIHVEMPTRDQLIEILEKYEGQEVWAHNGLFDIAWLIASIQKDRYGRIPKCIRNIKWRDSMLLAKWIINGQKAARNFYSYALVNICADALRDDPDVQKFLDFKSQDVITADSQYWNLRGQLDVLWTFKLIQKILPRLAPTQITGFFVESKCLVPVANSWIMGLKIDKARLIRLGEELDADDRRISAECGISSSVVTSPKQLGGLLFGKLGLKSFKNTPTGNPSTDEESLKSIAYDLKLSGNELSKTVDKIMEMKYNSTVRSKYVGTTLKALERTGDGYVYPIPRLFGTDTGRFTYSNQTVPGVKVSLAAHQMPRTEKRVREAVVAPDHLWLSEWDAAGQESRLMCLHSQDPVMLDIFWNNKNFHSMTGCSIIGHPYEDFQRKVDAEVAEFVEYRQMGKLANLSCNYRISGPALSAQAFNKYDMVLSIATGYQLVNTFKSKYEGVPKYWTKAILMAQHDGYAASSADRRFHIDDWSRRWPAEQTALSHPIQGSGAEHKLIAIATVYDQNEDALFQMDLHDGLFYLVPNESTHMEVGRIMNSINYDGLWSKMPTNIKLPFDGKFGRSFRDVK
jgi:DNA polymerase I-like protein with 3'-5' exonuclease and polymerase domains